MKVSVTNRVIAKIIDLFITFMAAALLPVILGPLVGFVYSLAADGMPFAGFEGQSVGKKLLGLRVVNRVTGGPATLKDSLRRNAPVGVATFFAIIPLWGWIILALVGIPLMAIEVYLMLRVETGHRLGDVMADTEVRQVERLAAPSSGSAHAAPKAEKPAKKKKKAKAAKQPSTSGGKSS